MGQESSKVLHARFMVLGTHAHVGVPDEVQIHRWYTKNLGAHLSELEKLFIAGNDFLQSAKEAEHRHSGRLQAVVALR